MSTDRSYTIKTLNLHEKIFIITKLYDYFRNVIHISFDKLLNLLLGWSLSIFFQFSGAVVLMSRFTVIESTSTMRHELRNYIFLRRRSYLDLSI